MATFDRTTIVRGPCKIAYDSATFYSKGGVSLTMTTSTFDKETDAYGIVNKAKTDFQVVVEFEPVGEIEHLTVLFPHASTTIGASIYGSTDKPLVITAADATYTINNAAVTQMPSIRCSANNTAFGSVQFTGIVDKSGNPSLLADYYAVGAGASIGAAFLASSIITAPYTATLGSLNFYSEAGFEIAFDLSLNPVTVDGMGTVDMSLQNIGVNITCIPTGVAENSFDTYFGSLDVGEDLATASLEIKTTTIGGLDFDCAAVQILDLQKRFSPTDNRLGQLTMASRRNFATGVPSALFAINTVTA
jgi:hypothetical protein